MHAWPHAEISYARVSIKTKKNTQTQSRIHTRVCPSTSSKHDGCPFTSKAMHAGTLELEQTDHEPIEASVFIAMCFLPIHTHIPPSPHVFQTLKGQTHSQPAAHTTAVTDAAVSRSFRDEISLSMVVMYACGYELVLWQSRTHLCLSVGQSRPRTWLSPALAAYSHRAECRQASTREAPTRQLVVPEEDFEIVVQLNKIISDSLFLKVSNYKLCE